jgi:hypothetical protein
LAGLRTLGPAAVPLRAAQPPLTRALADDDANVRLAALRLLVCVRHLCRVFSLGDAEREACGGWSGRELAMATGPDGAEGGLVEAVFVSVCDCVNDPFVPVRAEVPLPFARGRMGRARAWLRPTAHRSRSTCLTARLSVRVCVCVCVCVCKYY